MYTEGLLSVCWLLSPPVRLSTKQRYSICVDTLTSRRRVRVGESFVNIATTCGTCTQFFTNLHCFWDLLVQLTAFAGHCILLTRVVKASNFSYCCNFRSGAPWPVWGVTSVHVREYWTLEISIELQFGRINGQHQSMSLQWTHLQHHAFGQTSPCGRGSRIRPPYSLRVLRGD